jgi:hypothetical protein
MKFHLVILASAPALIPATVTAEPAPPGEKTRKPAVTASLIPVGANSDAYWVGDGPGIRAIALDPGAAPPATLTIRQRDGLQTIPTILNRPSPALTAPAGRLRVYRGQQTGEDGEPPLFADFKLPETPGHYDIFLNRAKDRKDWEDAESLILPASSAAFPLGSFRLVNLSAKPVQFKIGKQLVKLAPRRARTVRAASSGRLIPIRAAHADGESFRIILQTGIRLTSDQRANLVIYPGRQAKKPCEVIWYYQSVPEPLIQDEP